MLSHTHRIHAVLFAALLLALPAGALQSPPDTANQEPGTGNQQPATGDQEPAAGDESILVRVPAGSRYVAWIEEADTPPVPVPGDRVTLGYDPDAEAVTVFALDERSGYAARYRFAPADPPEEVRFQGSDFHLIHRLVVRPTGEEGKPLARARVTVVDTDGTSASRVLDPSQEGRVDFSHLSAGPAQVTVVPGEGSATTKDVELAVPRGSTYQELVFAIPEATGVLDLPPVAETTPAEPGAPEAAPAPAGPIEPLPPPPADGGLGALFQRVLGLALLVGLIWVGVLYARKQGWTAQHMLTKLGVQPDGGGVGQAVQPASGVGQAGTAPSGGTQAGKPAPLVSDPNRCQFCGEPKDAAGNCACSVAGLPPGVGSGELGGRSSGSQQPATSNPQPAAAATGPRLIGLAGPYMGHVFPLSGEASVGRETGNAVALDRDSTVSRRHVLLAPAEGGYRLRDQGSANGTFVNGARVTECVLRSGDEVAIGGTRFRFEG